MELFVEFVVERKEEFSLLYNLDHKHFSFKVKVNKYINYTVVLFMIDLTTSDWQTFVR